jgi:2-polyprenyl-3-methyl-5-hydroxy-6-metoxy-1,4-benzoquinol methylase
MTIKLEPVNCNLCNCNDYKVYLTRKDLNLNIPGEFRLVQCNECGFVYLNPRPTSDSINSIYPDEYDQYTRSAKNDPFLNRLDRGYGLEKRVKAIIRHKKSGRLLDLGCATGNFLEMMRDHPGWEVYGVEPNATASDYARNQLGLNVKTGFLEQVDHPDNYFDVITLWNVLEHLADPLSALKRIYELLKPDGILIFNTPNLDSLDAHLFGPYWIGFELPRHFCVFSSHSIIDILEKSGFKIKEMRCIVGEHAAFMSSIRFWLRAQHLEPSLRAYIEAFLFSRFIRVLTIPYFYFSDRMKISTAPTVTCVKMNS